MRVITGAAGFIGSCLLTDVKEKYPDEKVVIVDHFNREDKRQNYLDKSNVEQVDRDKFDSWLQANKNQVTKIYHLGARTDTTLLDKEIFDRLNLDYSKMIWRHCVDHQIPLLYASSAATYGNGEQGFDDSHAIVPSLVPLNPYGDSKQDFDQWVLSQKETPPNWYGVKFFNVYGPNEYHKGRMASVIFHTYHQILKTGGMKLFKSHRDDYQDGEQSRDFVYVKDVTQMCIHLIEENPESGLYNIGTGKARTFYDLAASTFRAMNLTPKINFIDTPIDIRDNYQYFTEANMDKLRSTQYTTPFYSLEDGVTDYVQQYLMDTFYY